MFGAESSRLHQTDTVWSEILAMSVPHYRGGLHATAAFSPVTGSEEQVGLPFTRRPAALVSFQRNVSFLWHMPDIQGKSFASSGEELRFAVDMFSSRPHRAWTTLQWKKHAAVVFVQIFNKYSILQFEKLEPMCSVPVKGGMWSAFGLLTKAYRKPQRSRQHKQGHLLGHCHYRCHHFARGTQWAKIMFHHAGTSNLICVLCLLSACLEYIMIYTFIHKHTHYIYIMLVHTWCLTMSPECS